MQIRLKFKFFRRTECSSLVCCAEHGPRCWEICVLGARVKSYGRVVSAVSTAHARLCSDLAAGAPRSQGHLTTRITNTPLRNDHSLIAPLTPASPKVSCAPNQTQVVTGLVQPSPWVRHLARRVGACESELQKYHCSVCRCGRNPRQSGAALSHSPPRGVSWALALPGVVRTVSRVSVPSRPTSWGPVLPGQ